MNFSQALENLKIGACISRHGWNGKGMWVEYVSNDMQMFKDGPMRPYLMMRTAQGDYVPWVASQSDLLAEDWEVVKVN